VEATARAPRHDGVTIFTGVPALFARLLEWARKNNAAMEAIEAVQAIQAIGAPRLRLISVAGSPLTPSLKAEVERAFGQTLHNGYGLTETGPTISQTRLASPRGDCSVRPPIARVELRVRAADGHDVNAGGTGELWVRGPGVMKGYYRSPELTAAAIDGEGWFNTGDLARQDSDGALFISGRTKELIIRPRT
jgi:long-chain acyl-CoA synthetase